MLATLLPYLSEFRGLVDGLVFSMSGNQCVIKDYKKPTHPHTQNQALVESFLRSASEFWKSCTPEQVSLWQEIAQYFFHYSSRRLVNYTAQQLFIARNFYALLNHDSMVNYPPSDVLFPPPISLPSDGSFIVERDPDFYVLSIPVSFSSPETYNENGLYLVRLSHPLPTPARKATLSNTNIQVSSADYDGCFSGAFFTKEEIEIPGHIYFPFTGPNHLLSSEYRTAFYNRMMLDSNCNIGIHITPLTSGYYPFRHITFSRNLHVVLQEQ